MLPTLFNQQNIFKLLLRFNYSLIFSRVHASEGWIHSQIPEVIQNGVKDLGDSMSDTDEIHADAFVQAYVHIMVGACISLGEPKFLKMSFSCLLNFF